VFVLPPGKHFRRSPLFFNNFTVEPFSGYLYQRLEFYYRCLAVSTAIRRGQLERATVVLALAFATGPGRRPFQASMRAMDIIKMLELESFVSRSAVATTASDPGTRPEPYRSH